MRKRDLIIEQKDKKIEKQQSYLDNINRICTEVGGALITVASESVKQELEVI